MSEIRGGGQEELPQVRGQERRAGRSYHTPEVRGDAQEELLHVQGQEGRP